MKRFTKKLSNDKVVLGKIYEHYVDSFDVDIIYDYQSERAEECGNKFYYGELVEKLAEYEDTGLTPQDVIIVQGLSKKYFDTGVKLMLENEYINKELEAYKRALKLAFENIQVDYDGYGYFVFNGKEYHYTLSEEYLMKECLKQSRKELKNEQI